MAFANEPAGTVLTAWPLSNATFPAGWSGDAAPTIVSDATAPESPPYVAQATYPIGFTGGVGPIRWWYPISPTLDELYMAWAWKASDPWQGHSSGGNKIQFIYSVSNKNSQTVEMYGGVEGPWSYTIYWPIALASGYNNAHLSPRIGGEVGDPSLHLLPNISDVKVTLNAWHRIELWVKRSTTTSSKDGRITWWVDGTKIGEHLNANYATESWGEFQIAPTWGGTGDTKTETDYFWYDHIRIINPAGSTAAPEGTPILTVS